MPRSPRSHYAVKYVTPDFLGEGESTPVKTGNVALTGDGETVSIYPMKRTSRLGVYMLTLGLLAIVPVVIYFISNLRDGDGRLGLVLAIDVGVLITLVPITLYLIMQTGNRITIDTKRHHFRYQTAIGNSVSFFHKTLSRAEFEIVYFSNTSAQSRFNRKGWAVFYRNKEMMFRLNMERWDVQDLWWMAENLPARIMIFHERTGFKYIEKRFPGYFPMFAVKPVLSGILIILAVFFGIVLEFILWALVFHIFPV